MNKFLFVAFTAALGSAAFAVNNFLQDPTTGDGFAYANIATNPSDPSTQVLLQDDLMVKGAFKVSSITTWEYAGNATDYVLHIYSQYTSDPSQNLLYAYKTTNVVKDSAHNGYYAVTFDTTGLIVKDATYIIGFQAEGPDTGVWAWYSADNGNVNGKPAYDPNYGFSDQWSVAAQNGTPTPIDMSWNIVTAPVPEPATMLALGLGLAAFAARRRK